jgi:peptide/nickel transport system substrate-binding protein
MKQQQSWRSAWILIVAAVLLFSWQSSHLAAAEPKQGGTLKVLIQSLKSLDPVYNTTQVTRLVARHLYDTLFAWDEKEQVQPMMVKDWVVSDDFKAYTFTLREGLVFHNGQPVTSDDVIASLKRWSERDRWGASIFRIIEKFDKTDDRTFSIKLKEPYGLLLRAFGKPSSPLPIIIPKELAATPSNEPLKSYIGSGPLKLLEWKPGRHLILERFNGYRPRQEQPNGLAGGKVVYVDRIELLEVPDEATQVAALERGEVNLINFVPYDHVERVRKDPDIATQVIMPTQWNALVFNKKRPPFDNVKMRQAVQMAVNIPKALKLAYGSEEFYRVTPAIFFTGTVFESQAGETLYNQMNLEKAKALLKEAGGPPKDPIVMIVPNDYPGHYATCMAVKEDLENLGFKVDFQVYAWATVSIKRTQKDQYDIFPTDFSIVANSEPLITPWSSPDWPGWYESPRMAELLKNYASAKSFAEQKKIADDVQSLFYQEVPMVRLGEHCDVRAFRKEVKGMLKTGEPVLWNIWIEK